MNILNEIEKLKDNQVYVLMNKDNLDGVVSVTSDLSKLKQMIKDHEVVSYVDFKKVEYNKFSMHYTLTVQTKTDDFSDEEEQEFYLTITHKY